MFSERWKRVWRKNKTASPIPAYTPVHFVAIPKAMEIPQRPNGTSTFREGVFAKTPESEIFWSALLSCRMYSYIKKYISRIKKAAKISIVAMRDRL